MTWQYHFWQKRLGWQQLANCVSALPLAAMPMPEVDHQCRLTTDCNQRQAVKIGVQAISVSALGVEHGEKPRRRYLQRREHD